MNNTENMAFDDDEIKAASELLFYGDIHATYEQIFRDAITSYQEIIMHGVPDKKTYDNICARAALANIWLIEHGHKEQPLKLDADDIAVNNSSTN